MYVSVSVSVYVSVSLSKCHVCACATKGRRYCNTYPPINMNLKAVNTDEIVIISYYLLAFMIRHHL